MLTIARTIYFFNSAIGSCGDNTFVHFSTTTSLAKLKFSVCLILVDEEPILTVYVPASATHAAASVLKEARSSALIVKVIFSDCPGCNKPVLAKPFNSWAGLSNLSVGALIYNCTASLPATLPVLVMVIAAVIFLSNVFELNASLSYLKSV